MSENANPEPSAGDTAVAAVVDEAPATKSKRKAPLRLRDMQSAAQNGGWMWIEKEAVDRLLLKTGGVESGLVFSTYAALCRLSSDRGNATSVTAGLAIVAKQAGCSRRTVIGCVVEIATTRTPTFCSRVGRAAVPGHYCLKSTRVVTLRH